MTIFYLRGVRITEGCMRAHSHLHEKGTIIASKNKSEKQWEEVKFF